MIYVLWIFYIILIRDCGDAKKPTTPNDLNCQELNISLTQKIDNEGFHKELHWLLEHNVNWAQCSLLIKLEIGHDFFLNPDQIADLNRMGELSVFIDGIVDIEAPAHLASEHTAYIFIKPVSDRISIKIPFHLRYQRAQISGSYGKVTIKKPHVLAKCQKSCGKTEIKAPCDVKNTNLCIWSNVSYQVLFDEVELFVPVGNLDDYPLVSIVTLLLGCAGCIYTLSVLSTSHL